MAEYIERGMVLELLKDVDRYGYLDASDINSIPAADVAPVRHGRWVTDSFTVWQCDKCHCPAPKFGYPKAEFERTAYCPNCGAKMDGDGDG